jgi:hypothetical protein
MATPKKLSKRAWALWRTGIRQLLHIMSDIRLREPLGEWTQPPRQQFKWFAHPNTQSIFHVGQTTTSQHFRKRKHHNSHNISPQYLTLSRDYTQQWPHHRSTALLADVSTNKGANTLTLHATAPQFKPPPLPTPPLINTVGDYIQTLPPFLQQLVPPPSELG